VTINLPRIGYQAQKDEVKLFSKITDLMEMIAEVHMQKRIFIEKLMALGDAGPLSLLTMKTDGESYLKLHKASYLIGMVGLDELVTIQTGKQMHQSKDSLMLGLKIISHMKIISEHLAEKHNMHFVLEQTPAESTCYRFAKLDLKHYAPRSGHFIKGDISANQIYYSNSSYLDVGADIDPIERVRKEGLFHPLIEAGALTHVWLGESEPSKESLANFVIKVFRKTSNDQIAFSPEFTTCNKCGKTFRGLHEACISCGSTEIEGITRITGYFTKISSWNKGKIGELNDRKRVMINN